MKKLVSSRVPFHDNQMLLIKMNWLDSMHSMIWVSQLLINDSRKTAKTHLNQPVARHLNLPNHS